MKRSKDKFYMKQIFDCISDGEIIATGKIAKEIGLSEKSVRNRLNELSDFLLENKLGEIQRKPRVGIWLEANENQKEEIQKILSDENLQVGNKITVAVSSVEHPMLPEHYIMGVYIETKNGGQLHKFAPGDKPEAVFMLADGDEFIAAYEYCNLHGLWKSEV